MTAAPRVTVIMPTHDRAAYLGEAIHSVLTQRFTDLELIVVDDGSTDATPALLAALPDPRLRVLRQPHRGISAAMNAGLRAARGEYLARLDSDDRWHAEMLQAAVAHLDADARVGVVYARGRAMDASGAPLQAIVGGPPRFPDDALRSFVYDDFTCNIAVVARRACVERAGGYDEALIANEDWDLWMRVARDARFAFLDRVLAEFRWHDGNLTGYRSPALRAVLDSRRVPLDKLFATPDLPPEVLAMRPIAYENVALFRGQRLLDAGAPREAWQAFRAALGHSTTPARTAARIVWLGFVSRALRRSAVGRRLLAARARRARRRAA